MNIKQFKLTNNEEIICEVVDWDTGDEAGDVLVKRALRVIGVEDYQKGWRFFCFRPWMSFQDDPTSLQTLNSAHIIVTTNPSKDILKHYNRCITRIADDVKRNTKTTAYANLDEIQDELRELTDDEMDDFLYNKYGATEEAPSSLDSDSGKIIKFRPRKTLH